MKSFLIIGMGRFGRKLAEDLLDRGDEVMVVDRSESIINEMSTRFDSAYIGDCTNEDVLKSLGVNNFDAIVVAMGEDFQSSLEITALAKDLGGKHVIAKASRDIQAKFLLRNGADEVVYPDRDMAAKLSVRLHARNIFDYVELSQGYHKRIVEALKEHNSDLAGELMEEHVETTKDNFIKRMEAGEVPLYIR